MAIEIKAPAFPESVADGEVFQEGDQIAIMFDKFSGLEPQDIHGDGNPIPVTLLLVMVRQ